MNLNPLDKSGFTMAVSVLWGKITDKLSALSKVAYSGKYIDLTGRPTKLSEFQNDVGYKTTDTTYGVVSKTANGLAPKLPNETTTTKYLRQDGTWAVPPNKTYGNMSGASASAAGKAGLVPAPAAGAQGKYLRGDGTWQTPPDTNTTYGAATQSAAGLMSAADKTKLNGVAANANNYSHPTTAGNAHIPAGGAANQVLMWLKDGFAKWANLGAAAFAGIANNRTTTEAGFLADARQLKEIQDQFDELNSALENIPGGSIEIHEYIANVTSQASGNTAVMTHSDSRILISSYVEGSTYTAVPFLWGDYWWVKLIKTDGWTLAGNVSVTIHAFYVYP